MELGDVNRLGDRVGKYYISKFVWTRGHTYDVLTIGPWTMSCMCLLLLFQIKARHPCMTNNDVTNKDHDTCIGYSILFFLVLNVHGVFYFDVLIV